MKNKIYLLTCFFIVTSIMSCEDYEPVVYDPNGGLVGVGFTASNTSVTVPEDGITVEVPVQATNTASSDRTYSAAVNEDETTEGTSADYTLGNIVIPSDSYEGILEVTFGNFENLPEGEVQTLVVDLDLPDGVGVVGSSSTTFTYVKAVVCNDLTLTIVEDNYADERDWTVTDADGNIVAQCSDFDECPGGAASGSIDPATYNYDFSLPDGCYTFTIFDSFGDGLDDGSVVGSYELSCSVITHASGEGNFGGEEATDFCVNQ